MATETETAVTCEPITVEWLRYVGFLPDGNPDNGDMAIRVWSWLETESDGREPAMQVTVSLRDWSWWLETYGTGGESLCLVELNPSQTRDTVVALLRALNVNVRNS